MATLQSGPQVGLTWTDNATNETGFVVERAVNGGAFATTRHGWATNQYGQRELHGHHGDGRQHLRLPGEGRERGRVVGLLEHSQRECAQPSAAPTGLTATLQSGPQVGLTWTDNATNETGFVVERAVGAGAFSTLATVGPRTNYGQRELRGHHGDGR